LANVENSPINEVTPSMVLPVITSENPTQASFLNWGLIPFWAKDQNIARHTFNARSESLNTTASFRNLITTRRCLVPAAKFFEWQDTTPISNDLFGNPIPIRKKDHIKLKMEISLKDEIIFCFAGLWDKWIDTQTGEEIDSFTIITTSANEIIRPIHNRMPVILAPENEKLWLNLNVPEFTILELLKPYDPNKMEAIPK
jgi:putative SOS response-associated peptidase YedK